MAARPDNPEAPREEALLSWIQRYAPYGVFTLDETFAIRSWNHWMEQQSALTAAAVTGKDLFTLFPGVRDRRLASHFERALQGESSVLSTALHHFLLPLPSPYQKEGAHMRQTARIAPLFSESKVCGIVVVIEDVTQRENQAEELGRQHLRDEMLSWALAHLLNTDQPRKSVRQIFFKIAEQLDFDTFLVYLRDVETGELAVHALGGIPADQEKNFIECPFLGALPAGREIVVLDAVQQHAEPAFAALKEARVSGAVAIPLVAKGRDLGLLCFGTWARATIAPEEVGLVTTIAQYLATALDRENTSLLLHKATLQLSQHAQVLEQRVQDRTASLKETVSELETFAYTIAHDLRAPVRGMSGFCDVLLEDYADALPAEAGDIIKKIARASARMESLTRDLLEFSKVSRQEIALSRVDLEPMIEELVALRLPIVRQAITIRPPLLPVRAHRGLLQHVFSNLVDNAVKFVRGGVPPRIVISTELVPHASPNTRSRQLTFSATDAPPAPAAAADAPAHVRVWVADEGIGIPPESHQKIFGIFERGVNDAYDGTGIGLAIVARAVQRMGGTCGVESEPGKGSRFWVELAAP